MQAARSEVLRHVLSSDDERCKAPAGDSISLPDLSHDELSLYTGALHEDDDSLPLEERQLLVAGDKYDAPFLRRVCETRLAARVEPSNVLRALEFAEMSGSAALKERAMDTVVEHAQQLVFFPRVPRLRRQECQPLRRDHEGAAGAG
jgi:speckle-type POZ protein